MGSIIGGGIGIVAVEGKVLRIVLSVRVRAIAVRIRLIRKGGEREPHVLGRSDRTLERRINYRLESRR